MRRLILLLLLAFTLSVSTVLAQFPTVVQGDIQPNDRRLGKKIDASKAGELTIASFNIRNLGSRQRSLDITPCGRTYSS